MMVEEKELDIETRISLWERGYWVIPDNVDTEGFDFSWRPSYYDRPYTHQFGTQWQKTGGPKFVVPESEGVKYCDFQKVKHKEQKENFVLINNKIEFDYSWHPDETEDPYIYVFVGTLDDEEKIVAEYHVEGATERKYVNIDLKYKIPPIVEYGTNNELINLQNLYFDEIFWAVPKNVDVTDFDFSWRPKHQPPLIHIFGTQWDEDGGPKLIVPNNRGSKIEKSQKALRICVVPIYEIEDNIQTLIDEHPTETFWAVPKNIDRATFDFSWLPNKYDPPYIHQFGTRFSKEDGPAYIVPANKGFKYHDEQIAAKLPVPKYVLSKGELLKDLIDDHPNELFWAVPENIDVDNFDFTWEPPIGEPPYIHQFGTTRGKDLGPAYVVPNSSDYKYHDEQIATKIPVKKYIITKDVTLDKLLSEHADETFWAIPENIDQDSFDFTWEPPIGEPPYIHQFSTRYSRDEGPCYVVPKHLGYKYEILPIATKIPLPKYFLTKETTLAKLLAEHSNEKFWAVPKNIDLEDFDFTWEPPIGEPPYIHQFGTQWAEDGGPMFVVPKSLGIKYQTIFVAKKTTNDPIRMIVTDLDDLITQYPNDNFWAIPKNIDVSNFDFSWQPRKDEPFLHVFGTQWQNTGGPIYVVADYEGLKYQTFQAATRIEDKSRFTKLIDEEIIFDYSWHHDDRDPPYIYKFGLKNEYRDKVQYVLEYRIPNATQEKYVSSPVVKLVNKDIKKYYIETSLEDLVKEHPNETFWALNPELSYDKFDFTWEPIDYDSPYVHVFGNKENIDLQTYFVIAKHCKDSIEYNYVDELEIDVESKLDMFYIDRMNKGSNEKYEELKKRFPQLQKTRFVNGWAEIISSCANRSKTRLFWILSSEIDYTDFDFNYYPSKWQLRMLHVFGTQWTDWGFTYLVNKDAYMIEYKHKKILEDMTNLNFTNKKTTVSESLYDIVLIDFGNDNNCLEVLKEKAPNRNVTVIPYDTDYYQTFFNLIETLPKKLEHHVWICSSICDYSNFDFTMTYHTGTDEQLYVYHTNEQKYGDTFLANVNELRLMLPIMKTLDDYPEINFRPEQKVNRLPAPVKIVNEDTHVNAIDTNFKFPYQILITEDNKGIRHEDTDTMALWKAEDKTIIVTSTGASRIIVPKEAAKYVKKELYDYPYIITSSKTSNSRPLDIVFFSNGEKCAEENYQHLLNIAKDLPNLVVGVFDIKGRVASQHEAARMANTPWYFLVNAKLKVNENFDFDWQPDRLQVPKHYIFTATNPLNGLEYGHQAIVANNKNITLNTKGTLLDFTLEGEHEVVNVNSGISTFNLDEWDTWRTAFREVTKLKYSVDTEQSEENKFRLEKWLTVADGEYGDWCLRGAKDAVEYYESVSGDFEKLKLTYEWDWLRTRFDGLR